MQILRSRVSKAVSSLCEVVYRDAPWKCPAGLVDDDKGFPGSHAATHNRCLLMYLGTRNVMASLVYRMTMSATDESDAKGYGGWKKIAHLFGIA